MARFFVSYSRTVKDEVGNVVSLLRAAGNEVWWDGDIPIMADWWRTILEHIEWCEVCIFVASEKSVVSPYCLSELKYASDRQRPILPFILDDSVSLNLPPEVPPRNQWLIYSGDPTQMIAQINEAYNHIDWALHKDLNVRRPPEPTKGGKSLAKQFQQARRLANEQKYEEAKRLFRDVRTIDFGEWGADCDKWIAQLTSYANIVELIDDEATVVRARQEWSTYFREYHDSFDPYGIKEKLRGTPLGQSSPMRIVLGLALLAIIAITLLLVRTVIFSETPTPTLDTTSSGSRTMTVVALLPAETLLLSPVSTTSMPPRATIASQTAEPPDTSVPQPIGTHTPTASVTQTVNPSPIRTASSTTVNTHRPTVIHTLQSSIGSTTVSSGNFLTARTNANLRAGPGTNYDIVGSTRVNEQFPIVARTDNSQWFLIIRSNNTLAWISASVSQVESTSIIEVAATIPPTPYLINTSNSAPILISPENRANAFTPVIEVHTVTFTWMPLDNAIGYEIAFRQCFQQGSPELTCSNWNIRSVNDVIYAFTGNRPPLPWRLDWRVRAILADGAMSSWSETRIVF